MKKVNALWALALTFALYTITSWLLLFRDIRALLITRNFYPALGDQLLRVRDVLMNHGLNSWPTVLFLLVTLLSFAAYFNSLRQKYTLKSVIIFSVVFQIFLFFAYPILSTDIFYYILSDRLATVYHQNVWQVSTSTIPNDPFFDLTDWRGQTKIYGPVNQFFYNFTTKLSGNSLLLNVVTHKLLVILFVFASIYVVYRLLKKFSPQNMNAKLLLIFANPLFVLETAGSGHNDILMIFFMLVSIYFFLCEQEILSAVFLTFGVQVKLVPILLAAFLLAYYLGHKKYRKAVNFSLAFGLTNLALFASMQTNIISYISRTLYSTDLYWQSLPTIMRAYLPQLDPLLTIVLPIVVAVQLFRVLYFHDNPIRTFAATLFAYFIFFLKTYWNWYALWILVLVPFFPWGRLGRAIVFFTLTSTLAYAILWGSLRFNYRDPIWSVIIYLILSVAPASYYLYGRLIKKTSR